MHPWVSCHVQVFFLFVWREKRIVANIFERITCVTRTGSQLKMIYILLRSTFIKAWQTKLRDWLMICECVCVCKWGWIPPEGVTLSGEIMGKLWEIPEMLVVCQASSAEILTKFRCWLFLGASKSCFKPEGVGGHLCCGLYSVNRSQKVRANQGWQLPIGTNGNVSKTLVQRSISLQNVQQNLVTNVGRVHRKLTG